MKETIITILCSSTAIAIIAAAYCYIMDVLGRKYPAWAKYRDKYQATVIKAIKLAEKAIKNDTPNKALAKFKAALNYCIKVFEEVEGRKPTEKEVEAMGEAINVEHANMEANGDLK